MRKTVLITGATDGIGLLTARRMVNEGHRVIVHGRNPSKLEAVREELSSGDVQIDGYIANLSSFSDVEQLAAAITDTYDGLDVVINNEGVFKTPIPITPDGLDVRFVVNTISPYLLTQRLLPLLDNTGRVINLSSAAQAPVDLEALAGRVHLDDD